MNYSIHQLLHLGVAAHKEGRLKEAEVFYKSILKTHAMHPDANHNLGILATSLDKPEIGLPFLKVAVEVSPNTVQFWYSYFDALIKAQKFKIAKQVIKNAAKTGISNKELSAFKVRLTQAINEQTKGKLLPPKAPSQIEVDTMLSSYFSGNYQNARKLAQENTQKFPVHTLSWQVLGLALEQQKKLDKALIAHQKALQLDPKGAISHSNLGNILRELGRLEEAETSCRQAIKLNPNFAEAFSNLGNTQKDLGRLEEAELNYKQAIKLKPEFAQAYSNLGVTLTTLGRLIEAEACYKKAVALNPNFVLAYDNWGITLTGLGKLKQAEESYRKAISLNPEYAMAYCNLGVTLQESGRLVEAEECFRYAIKLQSDFKEAIFRLGMILNLCGNYQKAAEQFALIDFGLSKSYLLRCLFRLDRQSDFYEKLDYLLSQGLNNALVGSLISRSEIKYGVTKSNPFCNDPLKYVVRTNLQEICDFNTLFKQGANKILSDDNIQHKSQGLLTNGIQTVGNVFSQGIAVANEIQQVIRSEIEKYRLQFKHSQEGLITHWPADYSLYGWIVSMKSGGELAAHIHEESWLSGSVYINVPTKSKADSGNLVVCVEDDKVVGLDNNQVKSIDVVTGSMCLFPASLLHYTVPFESEEERIVLAFDVRPCISV